MSLEELREEAIKAFAEYGEAMKEAFNLQGELIDAPLTNTLKSGDEETIKDFIAEAKRQTAEFKAMINKLSS